MDGGALASSDPRGNKAEHLTPKIPHSLRGGEPGRREEPTLEYGNARNAEAAAMESDSGFSTRHFLTIGLRYLSPRKRAKSMSPSHCGHVGVKRQCDIMMFILVRSSGTLTQRAGGAAMLITG